MYCLGHARTQENDWTALQTGRQSEHHKWPVSWTMWSAEELETQSRAQSQLDTTTSITWGEMCRKKKSTVLFLERMRKGHRQSNTGTVSKATLAKFWKMRWSAYIYIYIREREREREMGFGKRTDQAILKLNWNELWTGGWWTQWLKTALRSVVFIKCSWDGMKSNQKVLCFIIIIVGS